MDIWGRRVTLGQPLTPLIVVVHLDVHLSCSTCVPLILAPLVEEEERRTGDREITYLVVFPFLMTLALHLWGGLPVDLFVSPISYVTGTEREQGTSSPHQQPLGSLLQQQC